MKKYFRIVSNYGNVNHIAFDFEKLTSLDICRDNSLEINKSDNFEEFIDWVKICIADDNQSVVEVSREDFNKQLIKFSTNYNSIVKEL